MGVFEATAIALLSDRFSTGIILRAVALYRIISILADVSGAFLAKLASEISAVKKGEFEIKYLRNIICCVRGIPESGNLVKAIIKVVSANSQT